jgi:hypothetical protein
MASNRELKELLRRVLSTPVNFDLTIEDMVAGHDKVLQEEIRNLLDGSRTLHPGALTFRPFSATGQRSLFECHITYDKISPEEQKLLEEYASKVKWKTSFIEGDPLLGPGVRFFLTCHSADSDQLIRRMREVIRNSPVKPIREKIEEIIHDTKYGITYKE